MADESVECYRSASYQRIEKITALKHEVVYVYKLRLRSIHHVKNSCLCYGPLLLDWLKMLV